MGKSFLCLFDLLIWKQLRMWLTRVQITKTRVVHGWKRAKTPAFTSSIVLTTNALNDAKCFWFEYITPCKKEKKRRPSQWSGAVKTQNGKNKEQRKCTSPSINSWKSAQREAELNGGGGLEVEQNKLPGGRASVRYRCLNRNPLLHVLSCRACMVYSSLDGRIGIRSEAVRPIKLLKQIPTEFILRLILPRYRPSQQFIGQSDVERSRPLINSPAEPRISRFGGKTEKKIKEKEILIKKIYIHIKM